MGSISFLFSFLVSLILVALVRKMSLAFGFMDVPNQRSSHTTPTALMGGIGIILTYTMYEVMQFFSVGGTSWPMGVLISGLGIAVLSIVDDVFSMKASVRFLFHFLFSGVVVASGYVLSSIDGPLVSIGLGVFSLPFTLFFLVALVNVYNFMDGIDGYAGGMGVFACLMLSFIAWKVGDEVLFQSLLVMAGAIAGFLVWNFPKAKIFMGDVGSAFLGFFFGLVALRLYSQSVSIVVVSMVLSVFLMDSTVTILRRVLKKERFWEAHREHFYQLLTRSGWSHLKVLGLEYSHMVFTLGCAYVYMMVSPLMQWGVIVVCLVSFALKYIWVRNVFKKSAS